MRVTVVPPPTHAPPSLPITVAVRSMLQAKLDQLLESQAVFGTRVGALEERQSAIEGAMQPRLWLGPATPNSPCELRALA